MIDFPKSSWHIEISSKCVLKCPRCPRTENADSNLNKELTLDFFKQNFPKVFVHKFIEKIMFCGNDGDPIYAKDFIKVIKYFKEIKPILEITIITNGSYKKTDWWIELSQYLNDNDTVIFSIDGYDNESNNIYRINSDWYSIQDGIKTLRANCKSNLIWAAIAFKFNQDKLDFMKEQARTLGMDRFQLTFSNKFGEPYKINGIDELQPRTEFISELGLYKRTYFDFTKVRKDFYLVPKVSKDIRIGNVIPKCFNGTGYGLYVNAIGELYPCCWVGSRSTLNTTWLDIGKKFNRQQNKIFELINDNVWQNLDLYKQSTQCILKCS